MLINDYNLYEWNMADQNIRDLTSCIIDKLTTEETYRFVNDINKYTWEILLIFVDTIKKKGKQYMKYKASEYFLEWDFQMKDIYKSYRFLKSLCYKLTIHEIETLSRIAEILAFTDYYEQEEKLIQLYLDKIAA
jgi:hypothetical protein